MTLAMTPNWGRPTEQKPNGSIPEPRNSCLRILDKITKLVRGCGPQRGSLTINCGSHLGGGRRVATPPPHPPAPDPKALCALCCNGWSLFRDRATCPGQLRCPRLNFFCFLKKPLIRGSCAAWGRTFSLNQFFEQTTCPGQLRCLGQFVHQKSVF